VTELERIRRRGRAVEETITLEYLAQLNDAVALQVSHIGEQVRVLTIDSEHLNFADDQKTQQELINEVLQALPRS
jgi:deoxyadenosine/deoxycytidine kinase